MISRRNLLHLYLPVAALAAGVRLWVYASWLESPLHWFHRVPGLDMQTLLEFGQRLVDGSGLFTLHRTLIAGVWLANGGDHHVEFLAAVQCLLGFLGALLVTRITLHLFGKRRRALAAGAVAALYSPALMYEVTMLQESIVTFAVLLSFAGWQWAREKRFAPGRAVAAGILLGLAAIGRPIALLWVFGAIVLSFPPFRRRSTLRRGFTVAAGCLALWAAVGVLNQLHTGSANPFFNVFPYAIQVNSPAAAATAPAPALPGTGPATEAADNFMTAKLAPLFRIGINALRRIPLLFLADEIPDNLNFYFIRQKFTPLRFLPGPELLIPAALAGILLLAFSGRLFRREGLVLLIVVLLAPPLCALHPVGRYRLMLIPAFAIAATYPFLLHWGRKYTRRVVFTNFTVVAAAFLLNWNQFGAISRSTDFVAWALAQEAQSGGVTEESCNSFYEAFRLSGGRNQSAAVNLLSRLIGANAFDPAEKIALQTLEAGAENPHLIAYYLGLIRMGRGEFAEAERIFEAIPPEAIEALQMKYHFFYGETLRLQGKYEAARKAYDRALRTPGSPEFAAYINAAKARLPNNAPSPK